MQKNNYTFKTNSKDMLTLLSISKIATIYNKIIFKYTKSYLGKIAIPKTDVSAIPKKFMTIKEYINSKPAWKQIIKFMSESNVIDINEYLEYRQKESIREISAERSKLHQEQENKESKGKVQEAKPTTDSQQPTTIISKEQKNIQNKLKKVEEKIRGITGR